MYRFPHLPFGGSVDQIAVATQYLEELRDAFTVARRSLQSGAHVPGCSFDHFPRTEESFNSLHSRWDERRRDLAAALEGASKSMADIAGAFSQLDQALADQLKGN